MKSRFASLLLYILMGVAVGSPRLGGFFDQSMPRGFITQTIGHPVGAFLSKLGSTTLSLGPIGQGIRNHMQAVKQAVDVPLMNLASAHCSNMQNLLGLSYEQMQYQGEPNLNDLVLVYKTRTFTTTLAISTAAESLRQARVFTADQRLILFFHGFTEDPSLDAFTAMSNSFLQSGHVSLIALDASSLIRFLYLRSSTHVRFIGEKLAQVLAAAVQQGQDPSLIHLIGFSLGSHIAGFTGKAFQQLTGRRIGRITGLDPAGPCFGQVHPDLRLKNTDADYVDVIHTDAGVLGLVDAIGHKDYYPNSGTMQPNCLLQKCSHARAWLMFAESVVNPQAFPAIRCRDWTAFQRGQCDTEISYMGYQSSPGQDGIYFLQTGGYSPFGLGMAGINYGMNGGIMQNGGFFGGAFRHI